MTPTFDYTLALVVIFWWFVIVFIVYALIKTPGSIKNYINGAETNKKIKPKNSIIKSILIGIVAGLAPVLVLAAIIVFGN